MSGPVEYVRLAHSYAAIARRQLDLGKPLPGMRIYKQSGGAIAIYDEASGVFAGFTRDGVPQAMYKPAPYNAETNPNGYRDLEEWLAKRGDLLKEE